MLRWEVLSSVKPSKPSVTYLLNILDSNASFAPNISKKKHAAIWMKNQVAAKHESKLTNHLKKIIIVKCSVLQNFKCSWSDFFQKISLAKVGSFWQNSLKFTFFFMEYVFKQTADVCTVYLLKVKKLDTISTGLTFLCFCYLSTSYCTTLVLSGYWA